MPTRQELNYLAEQTVQSAPPYCSLSGGEFGSQARSAVMLQLGVLATAAESVESAESELENAKLVAPSLPALASHFSLKLASFTVHKPLG